jgi:hypothetical protein
MMVKKKSVKKKENPIESEKKDDSNEKSTASFNKKERKLEKELLWIGGFMILLVLVFFGANAYFKGLGKIEHEGLTFSKEKLGEIPIYHYYYYFKGDNQAVFKYNLYLRNDPSTNIVPITGDAIFLDNKRIFLSIDAENLQECQQSILAVADITSFLTDNQFNVASGNPNFFDAGKNNVDWVTCENHKKSTVIVLEKGETTGINIDDNCHTITVSDCQVLEAVEKYKVQSIIDAKASEPQLQEEEL